MRVKVERIRPGRRLPEVDYVEARPRRRPPGDGQESQGMPAGQRPPEPDHSRTKLRLPWRINHRTDQS